MRLVLIAASPLGTHFEYVVIGIPLLLLGWGLTGIWSLCWCLGCVWHGHWRPALRGLLLPLVLAGVAANLIPFLRACHLAGDVVISM
jgi:hypothetical protein